jgi:hypothetical protein
VSDGDGHEVEWLDSVGERDPEVHDSFTLPVVGRFDADHLDRDVVYLYPATGVRPTPVPDRARTARREEPG